MLRYKPISVKHFFKLNINLLINFIITTKTIKIINYRVTNQRCFKQKVKKIP